MNATEPVARRLFYEPACPRRITRRVAWLTAGILAAGGCTGTDRADRGPRAARSDAPPRATIAPSQPGVVQCPSGSDDAGPRVVEFGPGLRIDYRVPQVEIDGEVILRAGELELFAYSRAPTPKEHESIVLLTAKPSRIYQALGLIGLTPGQTTRYFFETQTTRLPTGDPVDVLVRYRDGDQVRTVSACAWMREAETGRPLPQTYWLFTGSEFVGDGVFYADEEGTTVTVVDFPSSLLSLPDRHSESNAELWLLAHTEAIPPLRTQATVILRPHPTTLSLRLAAERRITLRAPPTPAIQSPAPAEDGSDAPDSADLKFSDVSAAVEAVRHRTRGWTDRATVEIISEPGFDTEILASLRHGLTALGITVVERGAKSAATSAPPPAAPVP